MTHRFTGELAELMRKCITASAIETANRPVARVGRFEANTSTAILAAWATFQTRAALEHDFAFMEADKK
jgi:hypothetical protein